MNKLIILGFFLITILFFSSDMLFASDDYTEPPTVNSITGPTSGVVGNTYTFSTTTSSIESFPIDTVIIYQTTNPNTTFDSKMLGYIHAGEPGCSTTSCSYSTTFTPTTSGTYYIYVAVNFVGTSCNTHLSTSEANCFDSRGKYITFVVSAEETSETELPDTGISNIYISIIGGLFILMGFVIGRDIHPTRREIIFKNFEDKFKNR